MDVVADWAGAHIYALRLAKRMNATEFAAAVGVCRDTVLRWEAGKRRPRIHHQDALDRVLRQGGDETQQRMAAYLDNPHLDLTDMEDSL